MKKLLLILLLLIPIISYGANISSKKILILYYSRTQNTEKLAKEIQKITFGDLLKIETVKPYPSQYHATIKQVQDELKEGFLPPLNTNLSEIDKYDVIFLGYPIWWGTTPPPLKTLFSQKNLKEKTIISFCTHGGGGVGRSIDDIKKDNLGANVISSPFSTSNADMSISDGSLKKWLEENNVHWGK